MKNGKTLVELAQELERQSKAKKDFIAPAGKICFKMTSNNPEGVLEPKIQLAKLGSFGVNDLAQEQIAGRLQIPKKYYDKMKGSAPSLLETNVNHWLGVEPESFMIRTLDGNARAFLSSKYRPLDNHDLAEAVLPELSKMVVRVESCEITERHLYIKAVTEKVTAEIQKGDIVQAGIVISNSEVGCGSVKIEPMIYRLVCSNGLIRDDNSLRKYHVGRRGDIDELGEYFKDETRRLDDKAFWMKVRDIVQSALEDKIFQVGVEKMRASIQRVMIAQPADAIKVIENVGRSYGVQEGEQQGILAHLLKGGDFNQYGLVNAVTRASQDLQDYERATDLERIGGQILELQGKNWDNLVKVA